MTHNKFNITSLHNFSADLDIPDSIANSIGSPEQPHKVKLTEPHDETDKKTTSDSNKSISKPRRERFRKLRLKRIGQCNGFL